MKFLDLFAGIGGFRLGMEAAGHERLNKSNHGLYSLKTLKGYYLTTKGELSELSSPPLMNWGTMSNGRYLTAKISEFHKTENVCSLLDILEEQVDEKYFLSQELTQRLIINASKK